MPGVEEPEPNEEPSEARRELGQPVARLGAERFCHNTFLCKKLRLVYKSSVCVKTALV